MKELLSNVSIKVNENIYLKDPESSELGRKIIEGSIDLIEDVGFEDFTFKKLGVFIGSTEASVYRYFENKYKLLLYLDSWYWGWLEYRIVFSTVNIESPEERLSNAIRVVTEKIEIDGQFEHIDEHKLNQIVINESSKAYLNKYVDEENRLGIFKGYKSLVARISDIILELSPDFKYSHMLVSTIIEGVHLQRFFAEHLPGLTDQVAGEDAPVNFYTELVFKAIK